MNKRLCLKIARRMNTLLSEQLGEGVRPQQMLDDALYARDVLLVCDAMDDSELRKLSRLFRQALLEPDEARPLREPRSIAGMLNSIFGNPQETEAELAIEPDAGRSGQTGPAAWARRLLKLGERGATSTK